MILLTVKRSNCKINITISAIITRRYQMLSHLKRFSAETSGWWAAIPSNVYFFDDLCIVSRQMSGCCPYMLNVVLSYQFCVFHVF